MFTVHSRFSNGWTLPCRASHGKLDHGRIAAKKIAEKMGFTATSDDRFKLCETQVNLDLKGFEHTDEDGNPTGIALPYVVTATLMKLGFDNIDNVDKTMKDVDKLYRVFDDVSSLDDLMKKKGN